MKPVLAAALLLAGCLSQNPPPTVRYYAPTMPPASERPARDAAKPLRLARVAAGAHLRERMVVRLSEVEVAFDELHLWLREPTDLVEEALAAALFERGAFARSASRDAAALEVRLAAFELVAGPQPSARVELRLALEASPDGPALAHTVAIDRRLDNLDRAAFARAIGAALHEAAQGASAWLDQQLP